ncbi:MAG: hypothetical protein PHN18_04520 [Sulfurospirillaceae bacterium]|nr:hypothetical protein [Sulfurospirillaceae bacterium]MDD2825329.1 hypothetical protein [Sulfurospirillaceae bacterium]
MLSKALHVSLVGVLFLFSGCSWQFWSQTNQTKTTPTIVVEKAKILPENVVISELDLDRPYTLVQDISVKTSSGVLFFLTPSKEAVNVKLKEEAARLGANAVIYVQYKKVENDWKGTGGGLEAKGKAVKFKYY